MSNCLWCGDEILIQINWKNIFHLTGQQLLCSLCADKLVQMKGRRCAVCSRPHPNNICSDCKKWRLLYDGKDPLNKYISIFIYNSFMKEIITRWKYQGDYVLGDIFQEDFRFLFHTYFKEIKKQALIVPIPLSDNRLKERGFNQAHFLANFLTVSVTPLLTRLHTEKQSKKTRIERMSTKNPFNLEESINKPVILVDDINTTGRTIRHAAALLRANGCPGVYAFTLIRG